MRDRVRLMLWFKLPAVVRHSKQIVVFQTSGLVAVRSAQSDALQ